MKACIAALFLSAAALATIEVKGTDQKGIPLSVSDGDYVCNDESDESESDDENAKPSTPYAPPNSPMYARWSNAVKNCQMKPEDWVGLQLGMMQAIMPYANALEYYERENMEKAGRNTDNTLQKDTTRAAAAEESKVAGEGVAGVAGGVAGGVAEGGVLAEGAVMKAAACSQETTGKIWFATGLFSLTIISIALIKLILWSLERERKAGRKNSSVSNTEKLGGV